MRIKQSRKGAVIRLAIAAAMTVTLIGMGRAEAGPPGGPIFPPAAVAPPMGLIPPDPPGVKPAKTLGLSPETQRAWAAFKSAREPVAPAAGRDLLAAVDRDIAVVRARPHTNDRDGSDGWAAREKALLQARDHLAGQLTGTAGTTPDRAGTEKAYHALAASLAEAGRR